MKEHAFGWTKQPVAVVGQGTWQIELGDRAAALATLRAGLDAGMTHIDTAELYGAGRAEATIAEAIAGRREEVFLVSKVKPENATRKGTITACERSLRNLRTDRLDVYLLHWPGPHPLADTIAAFEELVEAGKIRHWGVSNFDVADLEEALAIAGEDRIVCNQVLYHLEERAIEHRVIPFCEAHRIAVVGYSPFGSGQFPAPASRGGKVLAALGKARGKTPRQIALAFLVRRESLFTIPKTASAKHAVENAGAGDIVLTAEEIAQIDAAFPVGPLPSGLPMI